MRHPNPPSMPARRAHNGASDNHVTLRLQDPAATDALGARLATALMDGGTVLLSGEIGAGKSALARALIRTATADPEREVPSPSYTLINRHDIGDREIWHADLYRIAGADEAAELGLEDAATGALVLIEWPDRLGPDARDRLPRPHLEVHLTRPKSTAREATLSGAGTALVFAE